MPYYMTTTASERGRPPSAKNSPSSFGTWLKNQRLKRGWSSERMAEELSLSQGAVSLYERGARRPKPEKAVIIAVTLGTDPREAIEALMADTPGLETPALDTSARDLQALILSLTPEDQRSLLYIGQRMAQGRRPS